MQEAVPTRLTYFAPRDVLIPRVARQCIMRFCEALSVAGADVRLVALDVRLDHDEPTRTRDLWAVYGVERRFPLTTLPTVLRQDSSDRLVTAHRLLSYGTYALWNGLLTGRLLGPGRTVFYVRNPGVALPLLAVRRRHPDRVRLLLEWQGPVSPASLRKLRRFDGVVANSEPVAEELLGAGLDRHRVEVGHTGVALDRLERLRIPKAEARSRVGVAEDAPLAVYTGKVHRDSREIHLLLETARHAPEVTFLLVGGRGDQVEHYRRLVERTGLSNVRFPGFVAPADVFVYQIAADALLLYYPAEDPLADYRSPAKLFEYMASGNPVVSADYRSIRRILEPEAGVLVPPDHPAALAAAIRSVLSHPARAAALAAEARRRAEAYTWRVRARRTLAFIDRLG